MTRLERLSHVPFVSKRALRVFGLVLDGQNFTSIAKGEGISRQRASQLFWRELERRYPERSWRPRMPLEMVREVLK